MMMIMTDLPGGRTDPRSRYDDDDVDDDNTSSAADSSCRVTAWDAVSCSSCV